MSTSFTLICPSCSAENKNPPVSGRLATCLYCGAGIPLVDETPAAAEPEPASWIARQLGKVEEAIDQLPLNLQTDPARLKEAARKVWLHALRKKDGDWDEVTRELGYLVREAKPIFDLAAGFLIDPRSEVKDYIEPIVAKTRESADARPLLETVQSFGQAMAEAQGGALPENLDDFQAGAFGKGLPPIPGLPPLPNIPGLGAPKPGRRPVWQIVVGAVVALCCLCSCGTAMSMFLAMSAINALGR